MEKKDRNFKPACKKGLVWFVLNEIEAKMFCHYYVNFPNNKNQNSSCRKGNKNFQADGRRAHKKCSGHQMSAVAEAAKISCPTASPTEARPLNVALIKVEKETVEKMEK